MFGRTKQNDSTPKSDLIREIKAVLREVRSSQDAHANPVQHIRIKQLMSRATPAMIAQAEQELVAEGFSQRDLVSACDAHLELFREAAAESSFNLPPNHPLTHFELDHRVIMRTLAELRSAVASARKNGGAADEEMAAIRRAIDILHKAENHNVRQENTLFPILERHGIEQPPAIMWEEHTDMRNDKKIMSALLEDDLEVSEKLDRIDAMAVLFTEKFAQHTQKETQILYPASLELFSEEEWADITEECDNLGYFTDTIGAAK